MQGLVKSFKRILGFWKKSNWNLYFPCHLNVVSIANSYVEASKNDKIKQGGSPSALEFILH